MGLVNQLSHIGNRVKRATTRHSDLLKSIVIILSLILVWTNFTINSTYLGLLAAVLYVPISSILTGEFFFPHHSKKFKAFYGFLIFLALLGVIGTLVYWTVNFSNPCILFVLFILPITFLSLTRIQGLRPKVYSEVAHNLVEYQPSDLTNTRKIAQIITQGIFLLLIGVCIGLLYFSRTGESLLSIWDAVHPLFPVCFFLATIMLFFMILYFRQKAILTLANTSLLVLIVPLISILVIKYPFYYAVVNHIANQRLLSQFGEFVQALGLDPMAGSILSKVFNYIGFHTSYVAISKVLSIDVLWVHLLTPILFSLYIPAAAYLPLTIQGFDQKTSLFISATLLFSQFNVFVIYPPYKPAALALTFLMSSMLFWTWTVLKVRNRSRNAAVAIILTGAAGLVHPHIGMFGVILALIAILLFIFKPFDKQKERTQKRFIQIGIVAVIFVSGGILIPLYILQGLLVPFAEFQPAELSIIEWVGVVFPPLWHQTGLNIFDQVFYSYLNNFRYIFFILLFLGIIGLAKHKKSPEWLVLIGTLVYLSFSSMIIQIFYFPDFEPRLLGFRYEFYMNLISYPLIGLGLWFLLFHLKDVRPSDLQLKYLKAKIGRIKSKLKMQFRKWNLNWSNPRWRKITICKTTRKTIQAGFVSLVLASLILVSVFGGFPREYPLGPYSISPQYPSDYDFLAMRSIRQDLGELSIPPNFVILGDDNTACAGTLEFGHIRLIKNGSRFSIVSVYLEPDLQAIWKKMLTNPSTELLENVSKLTGADIVYLVLTYRLTMGTDQTLENRIISYTSLLSEPIFNIEGKVYVYSYRIVPSLNSNTTR